jgi:heptosyltransferase-2
MGPRVLIIKLGALGDVVRTAALLPGLARHFAEPPHVTWLTSPAARPLVERMPGVHRVLSFTPEALPALDVEHFDLVLSLDKEAAPCAVAMRAQAPTKLGIGLSRYGTPYPLNDEGDYYFRLGLDDREKFYVNQKSYQQLLYEALGLEYAGEAYTLEPTAGDLAAAAAIFTAKGIPDDGEVIGINPGAGHVFAHKAWRADGYLELIQALRRERPRAHLVLLGGADETELINDLRRAVLGGTAAGSSGHGGAARNGAGGLYTLGTQHPLGTFIALVRRVALLVAGDTLAMHLAIAQQRAVVALFGPTCAQEIDVFGRGEKIVSGIECSPCYRRECDKHPHCMDLISSRTVLGAVLRHLPAAAKESAGA